MTGLLLPKFVTQWGLDRLTFRSIVQVMDPDEGLVPRRLRIILSPGPDGVVGAADTASDLGVMQCAGLGELDDSQANQVVELILPKFVEHSGLDAVTFQIILQGDAPCRGEASGDAALRGVVRSVRAGASARVVGVYS